MMRLKNITQAKIIKSKKGIVEDAGFWIFRILQIMLVVFAIVFFVNSVIKENIETGELELELLAERIINSPACLAKTEYIGDTVRVYPGTINFENYDEKILSEECIILEKNELLGVKIILEGQNPVFLNKEQYEDIEPLTFSKKYQKVVKNIPVQIEINSNVETLSLEIIIVAKKR